MLERIDIVTLFPDEFRDMTSIGVTGRAIAEERVSLNTWNPRDFAHDRHRTVDDRPYGGGPGMVMLVQPLRDAIRAARNDIGRPCRAALMTPQGRRLDQAAVAELAGRRNLLLVCGRYEGVDERLVQLEIDEEWSLGDFVLSGGELAAAAVIDATLRLLPGVLGAEASAEQDSFAEGWLDHPHYTRPERVDGLEVPPVLRSGDHGAIRRWRLKQALGRTWRRRPELLDRIALDPESRELLDEYIRETEHD